MSIFYFKTIRIILNLHKIFLYVFLKFFQVYSSGNFESYKYYGDKKLLVNIEKYLDLPSVDSFNYSHTPKKTLIIVEKFTFKIFIQNILNLPRLRVIDRHYFGLVGANSLFRLLFNDFTNKNTKELIIKNSYENYLDLISELKNKKDIYVLGNNEDFSHILESHNPKYLLTCNSAINNQKIFDSELLILSFSDPLFHFGLNNQAKEYRKKLEQVLNNKSLNKVYLVVPIEGIPLVKKLNIPEKIIIVGLDSTYFQSKLIKIKQNKVFTRNSHNVFTQYLLPIASVNPNLIHIGAVTFASQDSYNNKLWKHDSKIKKTSNYNFAFDESFFADRDFKKYYKFHDKQLSRIMNKIPNKRIITNE
jgi:hypothetical protein